VKRLVKAILFLIALIALQYLAFCISRPFGDYTFLALAATLPIYAGLLARPVNLAFFRGLIATLFGCIGYIIFAYSALFIRGPLLGLTDNFGVSALHGFTWIIGLGACALFSFLSGLSFGPEQDH
jgi:hypothetical protein